MIITDESIIDQKINSSKNAIQNILLHHFPTFYQILSTPTELV